jgi:hypothetical protein
MSGHKYFNPGDVVRTPGSAIRLVVHEVRSTHGNGQEFCPVGSAVWLRSDHFELVTRAAKRDNVNHPEHYKSASGIECIDVIESLGLGFATGNAMKYLFRAGVKGGPEREIEDLKKAAWYIQRRLSELEAKR